MLVCSYIISPSKSCVQYLVREGGKVEFQMKEKISTFHEEAQLFLSGIIGIKRQNIIKMIS